MSKRHVAVLAGVAFLFIGTLSHAQTKPAEPAPQQLNSTQVQQDLAPLATAFGVKTPDTPTAEPEPEAATPAPSQTEKTVAGVADRALDMVENVTVSISNSLKTMAPEVWRIMIRQQYAKAISGPLGPLGWIIAALLLWKIGWATWPKMAGESFDSKGEMTDAGFNNICRVVFLKAIPLITITISTLFLVGEIRDSILYLVNPEYYAIKDLLESIMSAKTAVTQ